MSRIQNLKQLMPPLNYKLYKGQSGRVGVVGGSIEYTGAPFYSAFAALRTGVDLAHIFCTPGAAGPIKSYSPEIIVHPFMMSVEDAPHTQETVLKIVSRMMPVLERLDVLVIGPGLGRDPLMLDTAREIVNQAKLKDLVIVLDADALSIVDKQTVDGGSFVLTLNVNEFGRVVKRLEIQQGNMIETSKELAKQLGVVVFAKGEQDCIATAETVIQSDERGGPRRCGGQGDILTGILSAFLAWRQCAKRGNWQSPLQTRDPVQVMESTLDCCWNASYLLKRCNLSAYEKYHRGIQTGDILKEISTVFHELYE
ncbi:Ribokinase-like protein [Gorgonomyces haynaldii]|nr:Ribokinase-like protein [Gorgonomyces haynaldii]